MADEEERKRKQLDILKSKRWMVYKTWVKCFCPAVSRDVYFTVDGFYHLHTDPSGRVRGVSEQLSRYSSLIFALDAIKKSRKVLTYREAYAPLGRGRKRDGKLIVKKFEYWSMKERVKNVNVKVVLRKSVGSNKIIFWSVMA